MKLANRMNNVNFSATIKIADKVKELENQGETIIKLSHGYPHFNIPIASKKAAINALENNKNQYSHSKGLLELRKAIQENLKLKYHVTFDPDQNILITPGAKQAILYSILSLIEKGDEVIIPTPVWMTYGEIVRFCGGNPIFVNNININHEEIKAKITTRTRLIILNSPNNPTGKVIKKQELEKIYQLCLEKNIFLLCDEIYDEILYIEGFTSILEIAPNLKNIILINGFSKSYSMTGWRLAYVIAEKDIVTNLLKIQQNSATCPVTTLQYGAIKAFEDKDYIKRNLSEYKSNRNYLISELAHIPNIEPIIPEGAIYMLINISKINSNSEEFALDFLEKEKVAVVPGFAFGAKGHIRICIATSSDKLKEFIKRLKNYVR